MALKCPPTIPRPVDMLVHMAKGGFVDLRGGFGGGETILDYLGRTMSSLGFSERKESERVLEEAIRESQKKRDGSGGRSWRDAFTGQGMGAASGSKRRQGMDFPVEPLEDMQLCQHLDFSAGKLIFCFLPEL